MYLNMCQEVSLLPEGMYLMKIDVPKRLQVMIVKGNGASNTAYYPDGYVLSFARGKTVHTCILHDLVANAVYRTDLSNVEPVIKNGD